MSCQYDGEVFVVGNEGVDPKGLARLLVASSAVTIHFLVYTNKIQYLFCHSVTYFSSFPRK